MIQIDMKMPKSCAECRLRNYQAACCCMAMKTYENTAGFEENRPEWCPLKEPESRSSHIQRVKEIFDDFCKHYNFMPRSMIVAENVLQDMRDEVRELYKVPALSYIEPKYYGVPVKTVNDNEVVLSTDDGSVVKYSLREVEPE